MPEGPTWTEVAAHEGALVLVVPVGSYEQHGPHLPLDTDTQIAGALAAPLAERSDVVVAPPVAFGASGEHAGFPGTLSIGHDALAAVLVEIVRSARRAFRGVVFVSGHGGNADALARASRLSRIEGDDVLCWAPRIVGADAHAGRTETSLLLAINPSAVRRDAAEPGCRDDLAEVIGRLRAEGVRAVAPNGVLGDPRGATTAEGEQLLAALRADLAAALDRWSAALANPAGTGLGATRAEGTAP
jgi:mycofactocin system creatininase family protein